MKNKQGFGFIGVVIILIVAFMVVRSEFAHENEGYHESVLAVEELSGAEAEAEHNEVEEVPELNEVEEEAELTETEEAAEALAEEVAETEEEVSRGKVNKVDKEYRFRSKKLLNQHYEKHGYDMGFKNAAAYEAAASKVINNPDALTKTEKEDGDYVYYVEATNEFVVLSKDGYIRTYFEPDRGIDYYNRQ